MADERVITELVVQGAQKFIADFAASNQAVQQLTSTLQQAERIRTPQLAPQIAQITSALTQAKQSAVQFVGTLGDLTSATQQVTTESNKKTTAINEQSNAETKAKSSGITYLSTLSAIHAASFLAANQTFTLVGSFFTLSAAFSKLGPAGVAFGVTLGGALAIFGAINNAVQQIQQFVIGAAEALLKFGGIAAAALATAGAAGVKAAADFESNLAQVRAFGGATTQQLRDVADQAGQLARTFGVSAASIVEATSLFARAGGTVQDAIGGATEAIVKLQIASAGELQTAQAALAVSAALREFNLAGDQATRVADNLTAAAQGSALSFTGVTQAFVQAAPGAKTLGISIEDLSTAIALLGNQLVKGTITGTSFKQFILDLINPSKQAKAVLDQYGVSIQDANGKIRPLLDIVDDANKAFGDQAVELGKLTEAERARAIAQVFGSRASLAANILTREGAEGLQRFREQLAAVTATNITNVLLLPLNRQLEVLKVNVEEVGRAFGGPLLEPIRTVTVAAIGFFDKLRPLAELAGQAISVVLTNQGFGQLQIQIDKLIGHNNLSAFFIEIVNSARNVRDVIISQIVPAIQQFISTIEGVTSEPGRIDDIGTSFDKLNRTIQFVGAAAAGAITGLGKLIAEFIHGQGVGGQLRQTLEAVAKSIITQLVVSITTTTAAIAGAIAIMPILARISLFTALAVVKLAGAFKEVDLKAIDLAESLVKAGLALQIGPAVEAGDIKALDQIKQDMANVTAESQRMREQATKITDPALDIAKSITDLLPDIDQLANKINNIGPNAAASATVAKKSIEEIANELIAAEVDTPDLLTQDDVDRFIERAKAIKAAAVGQVSPIVTIFDNVGGDITDAFNNIIAQAEQFQRELEQSTQTTGVTPAVVDPKAIDKANNQIAEKGRDLLVRLSHLQEDAAQKAQNVVARALERLGDVFDKANTQLDKLNRDTKERIDDLFGQIGQRRNERNLVDVLQKSQEDNLQNLQRSLDDQERAEQRTLDHIRTARGRDREDSDRNFQLVQDGIERAFSNAQHAAETAFGNIQKARERVFGQQQDAETRAFQKGLDAESQAREDAQKLANATPAERANVQAGIVQAAADRKFSEGQAEKLRQFQQQQETKRIKFQQDQEVANTAFRIQQENVVDQRRITNDTLSIARRRTADDVETGIREQEEDRVLAKRLVNEEILKNTRRANEIELRNLQDQLETDNAVKQSLRITREANERAQQIIDEAIRQAGEVVDATTLQLDEQTATVLTQIRNIRDSFNDLKDSIPEDVLSSVLGNLAQTEADITAKAAGVAGAFRDIKQAAIDAVQQKAIDIGVNLNVRAPTPQQLQQQLPTQVIQAQTLTAASLVLPLGFNDAVAGALVQGLRLAAQQGIALQSTEVDLTDVVTELRQIDSDINGAFK